MQSFDELSAAQHYFTHDIRSLQYSSVKGTILLQTATKAYAEFVFSPNSSITTVQQENKP